MTEVLGEEKIKENTIFFGDSPNDEPMFAYFPMSCAVANINAFLKDLKHFPTYVTTQESGKGFAEAISFILESNK